jgi:DNA-directed RNA polymerase subunit M/transcription elongation factor TFIIS
MSINGNGNGNGSNGHRRRGRHPKYNGIPPGRSTVSFPPNDYDQQYQEAKGLGISIPELLRRKARVKLFHSSNGDEPAQIVRVSAPADSELNIPYIFHFECPVCKQAMWIPMELNKRFRTVDSSQIGFGRCQQCKNRYELWLDKNRQTSITDAPTITIPG